MKLFAIAIAAALFSTSCFAADAPAPPVAAPTEPVQSFDLMAPLPPTVTLGQKMPAVGVIVLKGLDGSDLVTIQPDGSFTCAKKATPSDLGSLAKVHGYAVVLGYAALCGERKPAKAAAAKK